MGRKNSAFTLVELVIVLGIIALLAVVALIALRGQLFKGNDARRKSDLNTIKVAVEEYEKDHSCYPVAALMAKCGTDASIPIHPYLNNVPCDPSTNLPYYYEDDGKSCSGWFRLYASLQNSADTSIISSIGLGGAYNFYIGSANAPPITGSGGSPSSSSPPSGGPQQLSGWACKSGQCVQLFWNPGDTPPCQSFFDSSTCSNQCGTPANPGSECRPGRYAAP